jgi:hypothetical protein
MSTRRPSWIQQVDLPRQLFRAERVAKRLVKTSQAAERLLIAEQIDDSGMRFERRGNHHQQLATRAQSR